MPAVTAHPPGTFSWIELHARDRAAAERFYTQLFGWSADHTQMGPSESDVYVTLKQDGHSVAALYGMGNDDPRPSSWLSYVTVVNADQSAAKARELGGTVAMEPFDVMDYGRMAVIADPDGAPFALWEP